MKTIVKSLTYAAVLSGIFCMSLSVKAAEPASCVVATEAQISAMFDRWSTSLVDGKWLIAHHLGGRKLVGSTSNAARPAPDELSNPARKPAREDNPIAAASEPSESGTWRLTEMRMPALAQ